MRTLEVDRLSRTYETSRETVHALHEASFAVDAGEIVGLLGLNGAGKTTMLKVVATLLLPTAGTVRVAGHDVVSATTEARRHFSVVFGGERGFYHRLSARENLEFFGALSGMARASLRQRVSQALDDVGLSDVGERAVEAFSKGMKQRLHLALGLMTTPKLLLLDEPTVGLDPLEAERLRETIADLRGTGVAVLLTSHYLADIERLASRVIVLQRGRVTHDLPLERLLARARAAAAVHVSGTGDPPSAVDATAPVDGGRVHLVATSADRDGTGWTLTFEIEEWTPSTLRALASLWPEHEITDVRVEPASLERVFAELAQAGVDA